MKRSAVLQEFNKQAALCLSFRGRGESQQINMQKCCTVRLHGQDLRDGCRCFFICAENNLARGRSLYTPHSSVCASDFDKRFHTSKGFSPDVNFELTQVAVKLIKPHQSHHNSAVFPPDTRSKQQEREIIRN